MIFLSFQFAHQMQWHSQAWIHADLNFPVYCEFKALILCALQIDISLVTIMILSSFPWAILFFPIAEVPDRFYADVNSLLYFVIKYGICLEIDPVKFNFGKCFFAFFKT